MNWWLSRAWMWLTSVGLCAGCSEDPEVSPLRTVEQPEVMYAGCVEVIGGACVLPADRDAPVTIWVDVQRHTQLAVTLDGAPVKVEGTGVDGGVRLLVPTGPDAQRLQVTGLDPAWREPWAMSIQRIRPSTAMVEAEALRQSGDTDGAVAVLRDALPELSGIDRLSALRFLAKAQYAKGETEKSIRAHEPVLDLAESLGCVRTMARTAMSLVSMHLHDGDLQAVAPLFDRLDRAAYAVPDAQAVVLRERAQLAAKVGDLSQAIRLAEQSVRIADRLQRFGLLVDGLVDLSIWYAELNQWSKVEPCLTQLMTLADEPALPCPMRLAAVSAVGWAQLQAAGAQAWEAWPVPALESALALAEAGGQCPNADEEANVRLNLALHELQQGAPAVALVWLEPVIDLPQEWVPWLREIRVRAWLSLGRAPEHIVWSPLLAPDAARSDDRWNGWVSNARALARLGLHEGAVAAWTAAEAVVDDSAAGLLLGGERDHYVEGRLVSAIGLVGALVDAGRPAAAFCRARLARGRLLRLLDRNAALQRAPPEARASWNAGRLRYLRERTALAAEAAQDVEFSAAEREHRVQRRRAREQAVADALADASRAVQPVETISRCEDLPTVDPTTAQLLFFPADSGWFTFVARGGQVDVARTAALPGSGSPPSDTIAPTRLVDRLLGAEQIRVIPTGEAWRLSVPNLPTNDGVLLDVAPIVHALDLGLRPVTASRRAVVVADPTSDLPHARGEAQGVATSLERAGWSVEVLSGPRATPDRIVAAVDGAGLLHYAGHGQTRGDVGWEASLVLAADRQLSVQDILALPSVPGSVVLTGCETGAADASVLAGGMSLGRAFVLAGASNALVADRSVADGLAQHVGVSVYETVDEASWSLPTALRRVQLELRRSQPQSDWAAFRVIVP